MQDDYNTALIKLHEAEDGFSEIVINDELEPMLDGIDDYSHLVVLYWGDKVTEEARQLTRVHPMGREDLPLTGIAATCSPARPNPILMTVVRFHRRDRSILKVTGLDAIDGSPVLDIKPCVRELFPDGEITVPEWMRKQMDEYYKRRRQ